MKLRFEVDQAEAFRRGIDCPKSIITVEVNPAKLSQADRDLIADRMEGIDVCILSEDGKRLSCGTDIEEQLGKLKAARIVAKLPTFDAMMEAIRENEKNVRRDTLIEAKAGK